MVSTNDEQRTAESAEKFLMSQSGAHQRERRKQDDGFTLIELLVVVVIIAILIAVAIPSFIGARTRSQDRAAQTYARTGLTTEKVAYVDNQQFTTSAATLAGIEPNLVFNMVSPGAAVSTPGQVFASVTSSGSLTNNVVVIGVRSQSGTCYYVGDDLTGPPHYGSDASSSGGCLLPALTALTNTKW